MAQEILQKAAKWEATVSARLASASADQIWSFIKDFFGIHKYLPFLHTSYGIHGNNGEIGSIRCCETIQESPQESNEGNVDGKSLVKKWANEKITAIDLTQRSLSYEVLDNNIGFNSYAATMKVLMNPSENGNENESTGCVFEWSFSVDPVEGLEFEDFLKQFQGWLQILVQTMENSLLKSCDEK